MHKLVKIEKLNNQRLMALFEKKDKEIRSLLVDLKKNKSRFNEILKGLESVGFIKGVAMALFDEPENVLKEIERLENV